MDEATKKKISKTLKGRPKPPRTEEHRRNMSKAFRGRSYVDRFGKERAEVIKQKIIRANTGKERAPRSEEWKQNLSKSLKGRYVWNKGKTSLQKAWNKIEIPKDYLYTELIIKKRTANRVAKEFNVSKSVIRRAAREYNFPKRTTSDVVKGKSLEELHGEKCAKKIKERLSAVSKGRKVTWANKISKSIKKHYKEHGVSKERRKAISKRMRKTWLQPNYREKVVDSHRKYLKEHPEELVRLRKIQYPGHATKIELKVREFLNQFFEENKHFYYDKYDKTKQTFFRPDFQFPDKNIIIELDGYYKHFTEEGKEKDLQREEKLITAGWKIYRFTQQEIEQNFDEVKLRLSEILNMVKIVAGADEAGSLSLQ